MLATTQRLTTTGPRFSGSRFFASPRRAPRSRNARPAKRVAKQKTASRIFFAEAPKTRPENAAQTLGTHQQTWCWAYDFASGCVVAPNSGVTGPVYGASGYGTLVEGGAAIRLAPYNVSAKAPTSADYRGAAEELGWTGMDYYSAEAQAYYGRAAANILVAQGRGQDMGAAISTILNEAPGLVLAGVIFPSAAQLARQLGTNVDTFHKQVKPDMLSELQNEARKIGARNPDIGIDDAGRIVLRNPQTGKTVVTRVPIGGFKPQGP